MRVERYSRIGQLATPWDDLADRVDASPWLRPGWISAWVDAFGRGAPLEVFAVQRGDRVAGVLPMLHRRGSLGSPTNWHTPEFGLLAENAEAGLALAEAVLADRPRSITLGVSSAEGLEPMREAASRASYHVLERPLMRSPYLSLQAAGSSEAPERIHPRGASVRRYRRKLESAGELRFDVEPQMEHLEDGFRVEGSGWKEQRGTAIVSRPDTRRFYEAIARWAAERGTLRLFFLRLDERPIAFVLGLEDGGRLFYVKGGYDVEFRRFGPGLILVHAMIEYAEGRALRSFEFLGDDDPWKLEWTSDVRDRLLFQAFSPAPAGLAEWALYAYVRPLARRLRSRWQSHAAAQGADHTR